MDQARREYNKKVLDRIASDPKFREELLDDPKGAMERAGLKWEGGDEVSGYSIFNFGVMSPKPTPPEPGGGASGIVTAVCEPVPQKDPAKGVVVEKEPPGKMPPPVATPMDE